MNPSGIGVEGTRGVGVGGMGGGGRRMVSDASEKFKLNFSRKLLSHRGSYSFLKFNSEVRTMETVMKKGLAPPNCQVHPVYDLYLVSGVYLNAEVFRSHFVNVNNIADDGTIAAQYVPSCDYHFQAN
jgi:hypothetical protein